MNIHDWRDIANGRTIPTEAGGYCDQPSLCELPDGSWLCSVTTSGGHEGSTAQYVSIMKSRDQGKTWDTPRRLEPMEDGSYWESSYSKLITSPDGTAFCFYCYNDRHITPAEAGVGRVDMGIAFVYRYSRDGGETWSRRIKIPIRETSIDWEMPQIAKDGSFVPLFWNVAKVLVREGAVYVPLTKIGCRDFFMSHGEGLLLKSENLFSDPEHAVWQTLPETDRGIRGVEGFDTVSEEHCFCFLSDGTIVCTFRTRNGGVGVSYSRDGGNTFGESALLRYPDGRMVKNTRANNTFWDIGNGRYLYWFTNCGHEGYYPRNPVWVSAAVEADTPAGKVLRLSEPEIILYSTVPGTGFSYPDILFGADCLYISETQKTQARLHGIPWGFIEGMFAQFEENAVCGVQADAVLVPGVHEIEPLGAVYTDRNGVRFYTLTGLSFAFELAFAGSAGTLFDSRDEHGEGVLIRVSEDGEIEADIRECRESCMLRSAPELREGRHRVTVVFDFPAGTGYFVIDGKLADGGETRACGWQMINRYMMSAGNGTQVRVGKSAEKVRIYRQALTVTECVISQRNG